MHKTQLTLSDKQLAAIMNAVQLAIVVLRLHQDVQSDTDYVRALANGFAACDSAPVETWQDVHTMLSLAVQDLEDSSITPVAHVPESRRNRTADTMRDATPPSPRRFDPDLN